MSAQKKLLRQHLLHKRLSLTAEELRELNGLWARRAADYLARVEFRKIAAYMPVNQEVSPLPLFDDLRARENLVLLPRTPDSAGALSFHSYLGKAGELETGKYTIPEPKSDSPQHIPDLILTPLLACDAKGNRLGYGGGYYDRTLAALDQKPIIIGCAYDFQLVEHLPVADHDYRLDVIITPSQIVEIAPSHAPRFRWFE